MHLDALAAGLEVLGLKKLFSQFPQVCKPILVSSGVLDGESVRSLLRPQPKENDMNTDELRVWKYLLFFIDNASEEGTYVSCSNSVNFLKTHSSELCGQGKQPHDHTLITVYLRIPFY